VPLIAIETSEISSNQGSNVEPGEVLNNPGLPLVKGDIFPEEDAPGKCYKTFYGRNL
jgi:hypothetical protein